MKKWLMVVLAGAALVFPGRAESFVKTVSNGAVKQGEWNYNFTAVKAKADAYGVPMVVVWANPGCSWCALLEKTCTRPEVVSFMQSQKLLLAFGLGTGGENTKVHDFAQRDAMQGYPFVRIYWPKGNVDQKFLGRYTEMAKWDRYEGSDWWDTTSHRFRTTLSTVLANWTPFTISEEGAGSGDVKPENPGPVAPTPSQPVTLVNDYAKMASTLMLPVLRAESSGSKTVVGVLDFSSTRVGRVAVKYRPMTTTKAYSISAGFWKVDDKGVAKASGNRDGKVVDLVLTPEGMLSASVTDQGISGELATEPVSLADLNFSDFRGTYSAALLPGEQNNEQMKGPTGATIFTVKMAGSGAAKKGQAKVAVVFPNGKSSTVSAYLARTSDKKVILPVMKRAGAHTIRAMFAFSAKPTAKAPNVIVDHEGVVPVYMNEEIPPAYDIRGAVYGSLIGNDIRRQSLDGWEFGFDASSTAVSSHGAVTGVEWPKAVSISAMGLIKGSTRVVLSSTRKPAKFMVTCLPGWEDTLQMKAVGAIWYRDPLDGRNASLGCPAFLQREQTQTTK